MTRRNAAIGLLVFLVYTALAVVWFRETWADPTERLVGGCCDAPTYAWYMQWVPHAILEGHNPLTTGYLNAPEGVNLMWQASVPLLGILFAPVTLLLGPYVAYNLATTLAVSLSGLTAYVALRRWVGGYAGPIAGGLLFAFSPYMAAHQLGHLNFTFVALVPLLFLALDDVLVRQTRPWWVNGLILGGLGAAQLLVGAEVLASTVLMCAVVLVVLVVLYRREVRARAGYAARALGVAVATMVVLLAYPLSVQFLGPQRVRGVIRPPNTFVTDLANYVEPTRMTRINDASGCFRCAEVGGYLGIVTILFCLGVVAFAWRRRVVLVAALSTLAAAVLALGPSLHMDGRDTGFPLPWAVVDRLPVLANMLPIRMPMYVHLGVAVLLAEGVRRLLAHRVRPLGLGGLAVPALALFLLVPTFPFQTYAYPVPELFGTAAVERLPRGSTLFVLPFPGPNPGTVDPMLWQATAGIRFRIPGGYHLAPVDGATSTGGRSTELRRYVEALHAGRYVAPLDEPMRRRLHDNLVGYYGADAVVVGPSPRRADLVAFVTALLGRPPEETGGVALWTDLSRPA